MVLFAEWSDKDTVNALATGLGGLIVALSVLLVRHRRTAGELYKVKSEEDTKQEETRATREDSRTSQAFLEMKQLVRSLNKRVDDQDKKLEQRDKIVDELTDKIGECEKDRARLREQGRWMLKMLVKHGIVSDHEEAEYPSDVPTPTTDEINIARAKLEDRTRPEADK